MPEFIDRLQTFVKDKPWIAVGAAVVGVGVVGYALTRPTTTDEESTGASAVAPLNAIDPTYPPVIINQPSLPPPKDEAENGGTPLVRILRDGIPDFITAGPSSLQCPPGYVSAQQPGQPPRCTLVSDAGKARGQRSVFFPSRGEGAFT